LAVFIAIEGVDGSGKGTQTALLAEKLQDAGHKVAVFSFPRYTQSKCGEMVGKYLNGDFGDANDPHLVSLIYAMDRVAARADLMAALSSSDVVLCDRYVSSNIAHQCAKVPAEQAEAVRNWITYVEYTVNAMPVPDLQLLLDVPPELAAARVLLKQKRAYTDKAEDLHEAAKPYLKRVIDVYRRMASDSCMSPWRTVHDYQTVQTDTKDLVSDYVYRTVTQETQL